MNRLAIVGLGIITLISVSSLGVLLSEWPSARPEIKQTFAWENPLPATADQLANSCMRINLSFAFAHPVSLNLLKLLILANQSTGQYFGMNLGHLYLPKSIVNSVNETITGNEVVVEISAPVLLSQYGDLIRSIASSAGFKGFAPCGTNVVNMTVRAQ